jgi:RNA binding exosome subunit
MIENLIKIADQLDSKGYYKEAKQVDLLIAKIAKESIKKPNKKIVKQFADETYQCVLNNIDIAKASKDIDQSYKFWEGHIGLNIGWAKNRVSEAKKIIMKSKKEDLSKEDSSELKHLIYEAVEALCFALPIPTTHHKDDELKVFNDMNYAKACKCGETTDDAWYSKNCK